MEDFDRVMRSTSEGSFSSIRAAFRDFLRRGQGGSIVLTASIASLSGSSDLFASGDAASGAGKKGMEQRASTTPLRRAGTSAEIAAVASFLLSDDAGYVTGQVYSADGGASAVSTVRPSGGAGAWDAARLDAATYPGAPL